MDQFEVVEGCAGIEFSYRVGALITLGVRNSDTEICDETAKDLFRAGFIRKVEPVERAVIAPVENAARKVDVVKTTRKAAPASAEQSLKQAE